MSLFLIAFIFGNLMTFILYIQKILLVKNLIFKEEFHKKILLKNYSHAHFRILAILCPKILIFALNSKNLDLLS